jgi:hypothetical protein
VLSSGTALLIEGRAWLEVVGLLKNGHKDDASCSTMCWIGDYHRIGGTYAILD